MIDLNSKSDMSPMLFPSLGTSGSSASAVPHLARHWFLTLTLPFIILTKRGQDWFESRLLQLSSGGWKYCFSRMNSRCRFMTENDLISLASLTGKLCSFESNHLVTNYTSNFNQTKSLDLSQRIRLGSLQFRNFHEKNCICVKLFRYVI